jgi:hypothetical protein
LGSAGRQVKDHRIDQVNDFLFFFVVYFLIFTLSKNASKQTHDDLAEQDAYLDEMSAGLDHLQGIALAIGDEVEDSTRKIRATNQRTAETTGRIQKQNRRVEKVLNK